MAHGSFQFTKHVHGYYFRPCQQPDEVAQEVLVPLFQICKASQCSLRGWVIYPGEWWAQAQARCPASENQAPRLGGSGWVGAAETRGLQRWAELSPSPSPTSSGLIMMPACSHGNHFPKADCSETQQQQPGWVLALVKPVLCPLKGSQFNRQAFLS